MATNENLIPIPGRLHSVATEGHVAGADEIYDDNLGITLDQLSTKHASTGTTGDYPYNGMGRVFLKKNMVNGVNTLTQSMMPTATGGNTIYVIQYDYVLGEDITVPENCVIEFDGGSISGDDTGKDTIIGDHTYIRQSPNTILNIALSTKNGVEPIDAFINEEFYTSTFGLDDVSENAVSNYTKLNKLLPYCNVGLKTVVVDTELAISDSIILQGAILICNYAIRTYNLPQGHAAVVIENSGDNPKTHKSHSIHVRNSIAESSITKQEFINTLSVGVEIRNAGNVSISNVKTRNYLTGLRLYGNTDNVGYCHFQNIQITNCYDGIELRTGNSWVNENTFDKIRISCNSDFCTYHENYGIRFKAESAIEGFDNNIFRDLTVEQALVCIYNENSAVIRSKFLNVRDEGSTHVVGEGANANYPVNYWEKSIVELYRPGVNKKVYKNFIVKWKNDEKESYTGKIRYIFDAAYSDALSYATNGDYIKYGDTKYGSGKKNPYGKLSDNDAYLPHIGIIDIPSSPRQVEFVLYRYMSDVMADNNGSYEIPYLSIKGIDSNGDILSTMDGIESYAPNAVIDGYKYVRYAPYREDGTICSASNPPSVSEKLRYSVALASIPSSVVKLQVSLYGPGYDFKMIPITAFNFENNCDKNLVELVGQHNGFLNNGVISNEDFEYFYVRSTGTNYVNPYWTNINFILGTFEAALDSRLNITDVFPKFVGSIIELYESANTGAKVEITVGVKTITTVTTQGTPPFTIELVNGTIVLRHNRANSGDRVEMTIYK